MFDPAAVSGQRQKGLKGTENVPFHREVLLVGHRAPLSVQSHESRGVLARGSTWGGSPVFAEYLPFRDSAHSPSPLPPETRFVSIWEGPIGYRVHDVPNPPGVPPLTTKALSPKRTARAKPSCPPFSPFEIPAHAHTPPSFFVRSSRSFFQYSHPLQGTELLPPGPLAEAGGRLDYYSLAELSLSCGVFGVSCFELPGRESGGVFA